MKKSLLKNFSRTLLVLACAFMANYAWADTWTVAGDAALCGTNWDPADASNDMTFVDGLYTWTKNGVYLNQQVQFKVVKNHAWAEASYPSNNWDWAPEDYNNGHYYKVTITFNAETKDISLSATKYDVYTVVGAPAGQNEANVDDSFFGKTWDLNNTANEMTSTDNTVYTLHKQMPFTAGEHHYAYKAVRNHDWSRGQWPNGDVNNYLTIPSQGLYDVVFTLNLSNNSLTAVAYKNATLANLCSNGEVNNNYKISDELVVVDYVTAGDAIFLQCKDDNNSSEKVSPGKNSVGVDQFDFLFNDKDAQNGRAWDQSNWIALWLQGGTTTEMLARAQAAKGHKISGVIGEYSDANNYTMKVQYNDFTIGDAASYTPNVYCVANFNPANLNPANLATANPYFFMTPKVQEICHITYAQWDGTTFTVPSGSQHQGTLALNYAFNSVQSPNLTIGNLYQFDAIVQLHDGNGAPALKANSGNYRVAPTNLTGGENNDFTAISTIETSNGQVKNVKYVNVAGMVSDRPFQGVNIVVTEYTDGTRTTVKVVK